MNGEMKFYDENGKLVYYRNKNGNTLINDLNLKEEKQEEIDYSYCSGIGIQPKYKTYPSFFHMITGAIIFKG